MIFFGEIHKNFHLIWCKKVLIFLCRNHAECNPKPSILVIHVERFVLSLKNWWIIIYLRLAKILIVYVYIVHSALYVNELSVKNV